MYGYAIESHKSLASYARYSPRVLPVFLILFVLPWGESRDLSLSDLHFSDGWSFDSIMVMRHQ